MGSNLLRAQSGKLLASAAPWATVMPTGFLVLGYDVSAQETTGNHLLLTQFRASGSWPAGSWDTLWFAGSDGSPVNPMEDGVLQTLGQVARGRLGSQAGSAVSWSQFLNHLGRGEVSASPSSWRLESSIPQGPPSTVLGAYHFCLEAGLTPSLLCIRDQSVLTSGPPFHMGGRAGGQQNGLLSVFITALTPVIRPESKRVPESSQGCWGAGNWEQPGARLFGWPTPAPPTWA